MTDDFSSGELSGLPTLSEKLSAWFGCQIHLPPLPQTVKNLDKAIGRLVDCGSSFLERNATLRRAKTKLDEQLIDAAGKRASQEIIAGGPIAERALDYTLRESILRQTNRETIARLAIQHVVQKSEQNPADATAEIEDDWLNEFSDLASKKSNAEIQSLWAKILSGKIRNSYSFSIQSLQLLSALDVSDAQMIYSVLALSIDRSFIYKSNEFMMDLGRFITLEHLGVLFGVAGTLTVRLRAPKPHRTAITMITATLLAKTAYDADFDVSIPCFQLTRFGRELLSLSEDFERNIQYESQFIDLLKSMGAIVWRVPIVNIPPSQINTQDLEVV